MKLSSDKNIKRLKNFI